MVTKIGNSARMIKYVMLLFCLQRGRIRISQN
jgi:hypothetical protein